MVELFSCVVVICDFLPVCSRVECFVVILLRLDADEIDVDRDGCCCVVCVIDSKRYCATVQDVFEYA